MIAQLSIIMYRNKTEQNDHFVRYGVIFLYNVHDSKL